MASTGNVFPTAGVNVDRAGNTAWTNPGNVVSDNTTDATVVVPSDYLVTSAYAFSAIPTNAVIGGVTVRVEASESGAGTSDYIPQLHSDTTPTLIGSAKSAVTVSGTTKAISTSGGTTDLWGAALTANIIHGSGFGVSIWSADTVNTLAVDFITIAIEYTVPAHGRSDEASSAYALGRVKIRAVGVATSTNTALALATLRTISVKTATEADSARADAYPPREFIAGPNFPSTGANVSRGLTNNWTNPGNVVSDNTLDATALTATAYLVTSNYGFSSVGANAIILGVTVADESGETGANSVLEFQLQLHSDTTPTLIGDAENLVIDVSTKVIHTSGGPSYLWGATLTPAIVKATGFGVTLWGNEETESHNILIDYVTITVRYKFPPPGRATEADTAYAPTVANVFGGITRPVLRANEADSAAALGRIKIRSIARSNEVDSAFALTDAYLIGRSDETDTAFAQRRLKIRSIGRSDEVDTAFLLVHIDRVMMGLAAESDTASALGKTKIRPAGLSSEADSAYTLGKAIGHGESMEADSAYAKPRLKLRAAGLSSEADSALAPVVANSGFNIPVRMATEVDAALALGKVKIRPAGVSTESDTTFALAVSELRAVGIATETDTALALGHLKIRTLGMGTETDTASQLTRVKRYSISPSIETDISYTLGKALGHRYSTETDTATGLILTRRYPTGIAHEIDLAFSTFSSTTFGLSSESDTAYSLIPSHVLYSTRATEVDSASALALLGGIHPHNNLPPYTVVYVWERTA